MASTLPSTWGFAFVLLLGLFQTSSCIDLLFAGSSSSLSSSPPQSLSASTLSSVFTSFLGAPSPFPVDEHASSQINQVVSPDFLHRPSSLWAVSFAGLSSQDTPLFEQLKPWGRGEEWMQIGPIELEDDQPVSLVAAVRAARVSVARQAQVMDLQGGASHQCGDSCLEDALLELSSLLGMTYAVGDAPLRGVLSNQAKNAQLDLSNPALSLWAGELVGVWVEAKRLSPDNPVPALLDTNLLGLQMIRALLGPDSPEFALAADFSWRAMGDVFTILKESSRELVVQIGLLGDVDAVNPNKAFGKLVEHYRRRLMNEGGKKDNAKAKAKAATKEAAAGEDTAASTTRDEYKDVFNTKAAAFCTSIVIFGFMLSGLYVMTSMDFTSDTLLYSQAKTD